VGLPSAWTKIIVKVYIDEFPWAPVLYLPLSGRQSDMCVYHMKSAVYPQNLGWAFVDCGPETNETQPLFFGFIMDKDVIHQLLHKVTLLLLQIHDGQVTLRLSTAHADSMAQILLPSFHTNFL
jgi:hypothetical protein